MAKNALKLTVKATVPHLLPPARVVSQWVTDEYERCATTAKESKAGSTVSFTIEYPFEEEE